MDFDFFFQAEDGIRDAQESRGLGDVYKRQNITYDNACLAVSAGIEIIEPIACIGQGACQNIYAVSYTHLTLPTKRIV